MDDKVETGKRSGRWPWLLAAIPGLVALYVLSVGPAVAVWPSEPPKAVEVFYAPVRWLHDYTPLNRPLQWYVSLWDPLLPTGRARP